MMHLIHALISVEMRLRVLSKDGMRKETADWIEKTRKIARSALEKSGVYVNEAKK